MSLSVMQKVWSHDRHSGSDLVILLALADRSDDDGVSWPGLESLAERSRITKRSVIRSIETLERSKDLYVERSKGRTHTNTYVITIGKSAQDLAILLVKLFHYEASEALDTAKRFTEKGDAHDTKCDADVTFTKDIKGDIFDTKGDAHDTKGDIFDIEKVTPTSPEPSLNHQEPSITTTTNTSGGGDIESSAKNDDWEKVVEAYESNIGVFTAMSSEMVRCAVDDYGALLVVDAIKAAVAQNVRKWSYVDGVLRRWKANGKSVSKPPEAKPKTVVIFNQYTGQRETKVIQ